MADTAQITLLQSHLPLAICSDLLIFEWLLKVVFFFSFFLFLFACLFVFKRRGDLPVGVRLVYASGGPVRCGLAGRCISTAGCN